MSDYPQTSVAASSEHNTHIYAPRNAGITGFCCIDSAKREIKSARTVLIKAMISSFYQYHSGCVFYYRRIAGKQKQACAFWSMSESGSMGRSMTAPQLLHINPFQEQIAKLWFAGIRLEMRVAKLVGIKI